MYSNLKSVQFLIAILKESSICNIVISAGNSHNAIVRSMEEDKFFHTYSIVDERSAAFFACGLAQELKQPVALCCTAGTAATNYLTGVTEAYHRNLPLIVITADKNQYYLAQNEDQMIDQNSIFDSITRYNCCLPIVQNSKDEWYCQRLLNEALLEMKHHGCGPVHINVPIEDGMFAIGNVFTTEKLPEVKLIRRYDLKNPEENWKGIFDALASKKVLIICGQDDHVSEREVMLLEEIFIKYNCVLAVDKLSNLHCKGTIELTRAGKCMGIKEAELWPDVVISFAGNTTLDYKYNLKRIDRTAEHWLVSLEGNVADPYKKLTKIFEGELNVFLEIMALHGEKNDYSYYNAWKERFDFWKIPEFEYSNLYTVNKLMSKMPPNSVFNIGNSTTIRLAQFFDLDDSVQVYCNRGVNGIDGCVSTFIGQACVSPEKLNFLIVGDLTFFYDMNAIWNRYVGNNVRIMLNNNAGAALFHFNQGIAQFPTLNENVAAEHFATAKGWVESQGFLYLSSHNKQEFDVALERFLCVDSEKPIFFEVFTQKEEDARLQHEFFQMNVYQPEVVSDSSIKNSVKQAIKSVLGDDIVHKLRGVIK